MSVGLGISPDVERNIKKTSRGGTEMSGKNQLLAEDFIKGLLAEMDAHAVDKIIATAKKGMETRYKNRLIPSWKIAELKRLRGQLLFGEWSWVDGMFFRQSWDGTITQDVIFKIAGVRVSQLRNRVYCEVLADKAIAEFDGDAEITVELTNEEYLEVIK